MSIERNYSVSIKSALKDLSAKEKVMCKDTTDAIQLVDVTADDNSLIIKPANIVVLSVHNESAEDKDYNQYLIIDENNEKYVTGSESFYSSLMDIMDDMEDSDEEWSIKIYQVDSKNYKGKKFLTCSII